MSLSLHRWSLCGFDTRSSDAQTYPDTSGGAPSDRRHMGVFRESFRWITASLSFSKQAMLNENSPANLLPLLLANPLPLMTDPPLLLTNPLPLMTVPPLLLTVPPLLVTARLNLRRPPCPLCCWPGTSDRLHRPQGAPPFLFESSRMNSTFKNSPGVMNWARIGIGKTLPLLFLEGMQGMVTFYVINVKMRRRKSDIKCMALKHRDMYIVHFRKW